MQVADTTVVVTGAGSGMGREMTLELLRRRARVAAVDHNRDALETTAHLAQNISASVATFVVDVTDREHVFRLPDRVRSTVGEPDILINNAGVIQPFVTFRDLEMAQVDKVMAVNFMGPVAMLKAFLPGLLARPRAHILSVSSLAACAPVPGQAVYGASKAALKLLTEALHSELRNTQVGVTVACPGAVATGIAANSQVVLDEGGVARMRHRPMQAAKAARIMIDAVEAGKARVMVGGDAAFMDRLARLSPTLAARMIARAMRPLLPAVRLA